MSTWPKSSRCCARTLDRRDSRLLQPHHLSYCLTSNHFHVHTLDTLDCPVVQLPGTWLNPVEHCYPAGIADAHAGRCRPLCRRRSRSPNGKHCSCEYRSPPSVRWPRRTPADSPGRSVHQALEPSIFIYVFCFDICVQHWVFSKMIIHYISFFAYLKLFK